MKIFLVKTYKLLLGINYIERIIYRENENPWNLLIAFSYFLQNFEFECV